MMCAGDGDDNHSANRYMSARGEGSFAAGPEAQPRKNDHMV